jgi:hypothetical protein
MFEIGFLAMIIVTALVFGAGFVFLSFDGKPAALNGQNNTRRERYTSIRNLDTNTIETVDAAGVTRRWNSITGK